MNTKLLIPIMFLFLSLPLLVSGCSVENSNDKTKEIASEQVSIDADTQEVINSIDSIGELSIDKQELIESTWAAYHALNNEQRELVSNYEQLAQAKTYITEIQRVLTVGESVETTDFKITLDSVVLDTQFQYPKPRTSLDIDARSMLADPGTVLLTLVFTVEALNSNEKPVDGYAISNLAAYVNDNVYKNWGIYYFNGYWASTTGSDFTLSANLPETIYAHVTLPEKSLDQPVSVEMMLSGVKKTLVVQD